MKFLHNIINKLFNKNNKKDKDINPILLDFFKEQGIVNIIHDNLKLFNHIEKTKKLRKSINEIEYNIYKTVEDLEYTTIGNYSIRIIEGKNINSTAYLYRKEKKYDNLYKYKSSHKSLICWGNKIYKLN